MRRLLFGIFALTLAVGCGGSEKKGDNQAAEEVATEQTNTEVRVALPAPGELNGHVWIDLGLSVKWATCNIGANNMHEYGDYYAWGDTSTKARYIGGTCSTYNVSMKAINGNGRYDAATTNWGEGWRTPTQEEYQELIDKCSWKWMTQNGVSGYSVKGPSGNSIFLPAAGIRHDHDLHDVGNRAYYWSSSPHQTIHALSVCLYFKSDRMYTDHNDRGTGCSVRPVCD